MVEARHWRARPAGKRSSAIGSAQLVISSNSRTPPERALAVHRDRRVPRSFRASGPSGGDPSG